MTRTEHLLTILAEECAEVAQRATKALRFGLQETEPGQNDNNATRLVGEYVDLLAVVEMLCDNGALPKIAQAEFRVLIDMSLQLKKVKIEHFLKYSAELGTLEPSTP